MCRELTIEYIIAFVEFIDTALSVASWKMQKSFI